MKKESYKIIKNDFEGDDVCEGCPKIERGFCIVYSLDGSLYRSKVGYCPISGRYASWREDKPVKVLDKKRVGQGKTKQGGNR